jgi:2-polyprenyl-3-methyl-5-hydroxy-6-metoxy-1,4-benzoquinol methylase
MNNSQQIELFGQALMDYYNGDTKAMLDYCRDDGHVDSIPAGLFFRGVTDMPSDSISISESKGRILDIGAGTGLHALHLQELGYEVCAIDVLETACEIMRKTGIKDVRCVDISDFKEKPFDTVLVLGRTIGNVGNLLGLQDFLSHLHKFVTSEGKVIINSLDPKYTNDPRHLAYQQLNIENNRYLGEVRMNFVYKGKKGPSFNWLNVDYESIKNIAHETGWECNILLQEENGNYLARLEKRI